MVDVPLGAVITYPDVGVGMQVLGPALLPGGGTQSNPSPQEVLTLVKVSMVLQNVQSGLANLMWIDCAPGSVADTVAYVLQPVAPPNLSTGLGLASQFDDVYNAVADALADGGPGGLLAAGFEQVALNELQQQGISCSNHNIVQAIVNAASKYHTNATTSPFTSSTIIPGSLTLNAGVISGSARNSQGATVNFQLKLTQCSPAATCRAGLASGTSVAPSTSHTVQPGGIPINPTSQQPSAAGMQSDRVIVSDINARLAQNSTLKALPLQVSAQDGVVTLQGNVATTAQKERVQRIAQTEKGVRLVRSQLAVSGAQPHQTSRSGIRSVDFQNFQYRPACLEARTVRVSNGQWQEGTEAEMTNFVIASVSYGDLSGDNQDEAVVLGACGGAQNFQVGDILIFSMSDGGPRLLTELSPTDWGKGEENNGGAFPVSGVQISR